MKPDYSQTPGRAARTVLDVANHYLSIGFPASGRMDVVELLRRVITEGSSEQSLDGGRHIRLHDPSSGARINVVLDQASMVRSAKPSFAPADPQRTRARITGLHPAPGNHDADLVQLAPLDAEFPLAVELEDGSRAAAMLPFGEEATFEIVGFAHTLECYADEAAYRASGMPLGTQAVLPAGLMPLPGDEEGTPAPLRAEALVSGVVVEVEEVRNQTGGGTFLHLVVATDAMTLDVVVASGEVEGPAPQPGHIVTGSLWFVARQAEAVPVGAAVPSGTGERVGAAVPVGAAAPAGGPRGGRPRLFRTWG